MSSALEPADDQVGLGQLQRWFHGRVIAPSLSGESPATGALVEAARQREPDEVVRPSASLTPDQRMAIYADMYLIRIFEALAEDYPTVCAMVGDEQLRTIARAYVTRFPSRSYTLDHTGDHLPEYLADAEDVADGRLPLRLCPAAENKNNSIYSMH